MIWSIIFYIYELVAWEFRTWPRRCGCFTNKEARVVGGDMCQRCDSQTFSTIPLSAHEWTSLSEKELVRKADCWYTYFLNALYTFLCILCAICFIFYKHKSFVPIKSSMQNFTTQGRPSLYIDWLDDWSV